MKPNKAHFSRSRHREKDIADVFNITSTGLSSIMPYLITLFFTPILITSSLFSKEIILILANIFLSLGYLSNFAYKAYQSELSKSDLVISCIVLTAILIAACCIYPTLGIVSMMSLLGFINKIAAAVTVFFLIKDVVIPPLKQGIESIAQAMGLDIATRYYTQAPLTLDTDLFVIKRLMSKHYQDDDATNTQARLKRFNNLLSKLCCYINKYDESIFGYIINKNAIADLEARIKELTLEGNADSSYAFIHKKIAFKKIKIQLLVSAKEAVSTTQKNNPENIKPILTFFTDIKRSAQTDNQTFLNECITILDEEIQRQKNKLHGLEECLPSIL